jgi:hypothetical protein
MSQITMTELERITALERFGYGHAQAHFLCLAALHGGYFLRRQYAQFLERRDGGTVTQFIQAALSRGHVRASTWRQKTQLYHLYARPFYEALGQGDNRNRRARELLTIKNKIMGLDFVLAHRDYAYLATEQEKLDHLTRILKIDPSRLPTKLYHGSKSTETTARYFVEKYPVFVGAAPDRGGLPAVSFCFVDEGMVSLSRFETFLAQYVSLFASLSEFQLIYVAASVAHFAGARRMFERFASHGTDGLNGAGSHGELRCVLEYFKARRLYETKQFALFDRASLIGLRDAQERFSGKENEALYEHWKQTGDEAIRQISAPRSSAAAQIRGAFSTYFLEHDYALFGDFPILQKHFLGGLGAKSLATKNGSILGGVLGPVGSENA